MEICRAFAERARTHDPDPDFRDHAVNSARSIEYDIRDRLLHAATAPPRAILAALQATSRITIAAEWADCNTIGALRLYAEGMWVRRRAWPDPSWATVVHVQPMTPGPGWSFSMGYEKDDYQGGFSTAEEAQKAADEQLRKRGWLLLDHEQTQPGTE